MPLTTIYTRIEQRFWVILLMITDSVYTGLMYCYKLSLFDTQVNKTAAETQCIFQGVCSDDYLEAVNQVNQLWIGFHVQAGAFVDFSENVFIIFLVLYKGIGI